MHDYTRVLRCEDCGAGVVEHHSHDCWETGDHSSWDMYWWWRIDPADMGLVAELAVRCPAPLDSGCGCEVHRGLGQASPPRQAPPRETPYEQGPVPEARVRVDGGVPGWA
ncbi:hypothetical protein ACFY4C_16600 [Actinomadura viridis]|uniref:hypothetical protein n=1 Tax=Actinomadura viridis TaxID=58110 RepID=UPI00369CF0DB